MCESAAKMGVLERRLNFESDSDENGDDSSDNRRLVLDDEDQVEEVAQFNELLCQKFQVSKSKVHEHRREIIDAASSSKIADTISIDRSTNVHVGHVVNITEQIVLNVETNELQIDRRKLKDYKDYFPMVDRMHWLAQPSVSETEFIPRPAKYVIICHTATQEAFTQAENILMLRLLQTFHIESQGWADIAYNFCIGSDGNAYEGRGWFVQGSHTMSYNRYSVGIAFIGCFLDHLPPQTALKKCQDLLAHGVKIGAICADYELVAHCQCRPFLSPGKRLYEEIKTWKNFNPSITNTSPCILALNDS